MGTSELRIGIAGCGTAARIHLDRLLALDGVTVVGCADSDKGRRTHSPTESPRGVAKTSLHSVIIAS